MIAGRGSSRREVLAAAVAASGVGSCTAQSDADVPWAEWRAEWRRMEAIIRRRGWKLTTLLIDPPASSLRIAALEQRVGLPFPAQLRDLMLRRSARIAFGWHGKGRSTLAWCYDIADFERMRGFGLDASEPMPDGGTLVHAFLERGSLPRVANDLRLLDHLLGLGLRIDARDREGRTALHRLVLREMATAEDVRLLVERGADKDARDGSGKRP